MVRSRILLVDDEPSILLAVRSFLEAKGFDVDTAETLAAAAEAFRTSPPDVAILDYQLPDGNSLDLLPDLKALDADVPLIVLTGHGTIDLAVRAIKEGADHFLTKPVELPALLVTLQRAIENRRNRQRQLAARVSATRHACAPFIGTSPAIRRLAEQARRVLDTESPILIQGETGAGKGVLARWLHANGPRAEEPLVDLNCAGLSREFLETELFGHEKGAFTGAAASKMGLLEVANRGTVFLDEIGDVDPAVQPKLLKVIEEKRFRRLGDVRDRRVDIRLIAATHHDLGRLVAEERFRATSTSGSTRSPSPSPRCGTGPKTSRSSRRSSSRPWRARPAGRSRCRRPRWSGSARTPGRGTSASYGTCSSGRCSSVRDRCSRPETCSSTPAARRSGLSRSGGSRSSSWNGGPSPPPSGRRMGTWPPPPPASASRGAPCTRS